MAKGLPSFLFNLSPAVRLGKTNRAGSARFARTSSELENLRSVRTPLTELRSCSVRDARDARDVAYKNTILEALNVFCKLQKYQIEQAS